MLRKVAVAAASNPHVEIRQDGEQFYIKTSTTVRTTEINFHIGEEFDEETVDGRKCKVDLKDDTLILYMNWLCVEWDRILWDFLTCFLQFWQLLVSSIISVTPQFETQLPGLHFASQLFCKPQIHSDLCDHRLLTILTFLQNVSYCVNVTCLLPDFHIDMWGRWWS